MNEVDEFRRELLIKTLGSGLLIGGAMGLSVPAWAMGQIPLQLPPGKSIYKLQGNVNIDNRPANLNTKISARSVIETGRGGLIIFAVGSDAFILRSNSKIEITGSNVLISGLRVVTGKLLSVLGRREENQSLQYITVTATIGVRGTGVYIEAETDQTYVCTCYGIADLASASDLQSKETVVTAHHDAPRYILADGAVGEKIKVAPVINHTDEELELIETLVGRAVPFALSAGYDALRNKKY